MGLLDELAGALGEGHSQEPGSAPGQLQAVWAWVQEQGGVGVLLQKFQQGDLTSILSSWIGTGENQSIGHNEIQSVFSQDELQSLASKLGTDQHGASSALTQLLPQLIDGVSPQGQIDKQVDQNSSLDLSHMVDALFKR